VSHPPPPPPPPGGYPPPPPPPNQPPYGHYGYGQYPPQPQWTPPPRIDPSLLHPRRLWYWLSPLPAIVGIAIAIVLLVGVIDQFDSGIENFRTPGTATVRLDKDDERGIYLQTAGAVDARPASTTTLACSVRDERERPVALKDASSFTLTSGNDEYTEQYRFVAPADGRYFVSCREPSDVPAAVGPHIALRLFWGPVVGMGFFSLVGIAASIAIAVITGVRRSNHKQRLQREARQGSSSS
jgi:hypothetical protein